MYSMYMYMYHISNLINPHRTLAEGYSSLVICLCLCVANSIAKTKALEF